MNKNSRARKRPMVPTNVAQSQTVPEYIPHEEGRKVPVQAGDDDDEPLQPHADIDEHGDQEEHSGEVRTFLIHSSCGTRTLQSSRDHHWTR